MSLKETLSVTFLRISAETAKLDPNPQLRSEKAFRYLDFFPLESVNCRLITMSDDAPDKSPSKSTGEKVEEEVEEEKEPVVTFRKVIGKKKNVKKRLHEESGAGEGSEDESVQIVKKAKGGSVGLTDEAANAESGVSVLEGTSYGFSYESTGAKRTSAIAEAVTLSNRDLEAEEEERKKGSAKKMSTTSADGTLLYTGQAGYTQHMKQSKYSGPVRQTGHVRPDVRMDYARDICKDFKETGYCGYGDTCIFLHDRGDYKAGWQIEREWELEQKQKRENKAKTFKTGSKSASPFADSDKSNDVTADGLKVSSRESKDLPFACYICRKPFSDPVVTKCQHYFCQKCALDRYSTEKTCAVCKENTGGSFNSALKILKRRDEIAKLNAESKSNQ